MRTCVCEYASCDILPRRPTHTPTSSLAAHLCRTQSTASSTTRMRSIWTRSSQRMRRSRGTLCASTARPSSCPASSRLTAMRVRSCLYCIRSFLRSPSIAQVGDLRIGQMCRRKPAYSSLAGSLVLPCRRSSMVLRHALNG